jgi:nucleotide-binding universal stress UspA family protein
MTMTILCATDFSPSSHQAIHLAGSLARRTGDDVVLVHVIEPMLQAVPYALPGATVWEGEMKASADAALAGEVRALRDRGISATTEVIVGNPAATLLSIIDARKPRLAVMGTHGRKGVGRLFLGSVAGRVINKAACPVLVTRAGSGLSERWDGDFPLRLAVGLDGTRAGESALNGLTQFDAKMNLADPTLVRLYWPFEEAIRYGMDDPWRGADANPELLPLLERDARHLAAPILGEDRFRLSFCMAHVNAAEVLSDEAIRIGTDALVIGVPRGRLEAWNALVLNDVLRMARLPVFCVPQSAATPTAKRLPEFRSALVAADLTDASNQAVVSAYGAVRPGGRVELVHVHLYPIPSGLAAAGGPSRVDARPLTDEARRSLTARLEALVPAEATNRGIVTNVSVVEAPVASVAIIQAAERLGVDFIALASHHRKGIKRAVLGSVAEDITRRSERPVLITSINEG